MSAILAVLVVTVAAESPLKLLETKPKVLRTGVGVDLYFEPANDELGSLTVNGKPVPFRVLPVDPYFLRRKDGPAAGRVAFTVPWLPETATHATLRAGPAELRVEYAFDADAGFPDDDLLVDPLPLLVGDVVAVRWQSLSPALVRPIVHLCGRTIDQVRSIPLGEKMEGVSFNVPHLEFPQGTNTLRCTLSIEGGIPQAKHVEVTFVTHESIEIDSFVPPSVRPGDTFEVHFKEPQVLPNRWAARAGNLAVDVLSVTDSKLVLAAPSNVTADRLNVDILFDGKKVAGGVLAVQVDLNGTSAVRPVTAVLAITLTALLAGLIGFLVSRSVRARAPSPPVPAPAPVNTIERVTFSPPVRGEPAAATLPAPPEALITACVENNVVLVAGDLLEEASGAPTGARLLNALISLLGDARAEHRQWAAELRALVDAKKEQQALQALSARFQQDEIRVALKKVLDGTPPVLTPLHHAVGELRLNGVMVTGWTDMLLGVIKPSRQLSPTATEGWVPSKDEPQRPFYLRLGGDLSERGALVLSIDDLDQQLRRNETFSRFLGSLWSSRVVLFVGMPLDALEAWLMTTRLIGDGPARHFALIPNTPDLSVQAPRFASRFGIRLLPYDPANGEFDVTQFLKALAAHSRARSSASGERRPPARLDTVRLKNIGPYHDLVFRLAPQWNVLLGNNGAGKSSLLKSIALGLCGDDPSAREYAAPLLRTGETEGKIELARGNDVYPLWLNRSSDQKVQVRATGLTPLQSRSWTVLAFPSVRGVSTRTASSAALSGGTPEPAVNDLLPLLAGAVDPRMNNLKSWVIGADYDRLRRTSEKAGTSPYDWSARLLEDFFLVLNKLTPGAECKFKEIDANRQVLVETRDGVVTIDQVSQGTSSIIGWVGTLLQRLYELNPRSENPRHEPAIVLVDEIDAHLHPGWQQQLVPLVRELFPNLQVIATTHSPLIVGSLRAGELHALSRDADGRPQVMTKTESFEAWRADQILTASDAFGLDSTSSERAKALRREHAELEQNPGANPERLAELDRMIPASGETEASRKALKVLQSALEDQFKQMSVEERREALSMAAQHLTPPTTGAPKK